MNKEKQLQVLEKFYESCLKFWEREGVENPKENALADVERITTNPFVPYNAPQLDADIKREFIQGKQ